MKEAVSFTVTMTFLLELIGQIRMEVPAFMRIAILRLTYVFTKYVKDKNEQNSFGIYDCRKPGFGRHWYCCW